MLPLLAAASTTLGLTIPGDVYLAAIGALFVFLLPRLSAGKMTIVAVIFICIGLAVPWIAFSQYELLFDPIYPPVTLAVIYISGTALAFMRTERERAAIRGAFGLYLSPDQVERIARHPVVHLVDDAGGGGGNLWVSQIGRSWVA